MNAERWHRIEALFGQALEIKSLADDTGSSHVGRRIGPFCLIRKLGEVGMGAVYLAERDDAQFAHRVAIKILTHAIGSSEAVARFRDERQILAALEHRSRAAPLAGRGGARGGQAGPRARRARVGAGARSRGTCEAGVDASARGGRARQGRRRRRDYCPQAPRSSPRRSTSARRAGDAKHHAQPALTDTGSMFELRSSRPHSERLRVRCYRSPARPAPTSDG